MINSFSLYTLQVNLIANIKMLSSNIYENINETSLNCTSSIPEKTTQLTEVGHKMSIIYSVPRISVQLGKFFCVHLSLIKYFHSIICFEDIFRSVE